MKKLFAGLMLAVLTAGLLNVRVFADEEPLGLAVSYGTVTCGTPITFTCNATGGDGNYKYRLYYWRQTLEDGSTYDVVDPTRLNYQTSPDFNLEFYASGTYNLRFTVFGKVNGSYKTLNYSFDLVVSDPNYSTVEAKADAVYADCLAAGCVTPAQKALWLHDWLVENCDYDYSYTYCNAEGALCRGKCTCEGYHRAYTMLLNRAGIENARSESASLNHVWTAIKLDGDWYQVDVTHDDYGSAGSFYRHLYYGLPESVARLSRADYTGQGSEAYAHNYFIESGEVATWSDPFVSRIQEALDANASSLSFDITDTNPPSVIDILYSLVAWDLSQKTWTSGGAHPTVSLSYVSAGKKLEGTVTWPTPEAESSESESSEAESSKSEISEIESSEMESSESESKSVIESVPESREESKQESESSLEPESTSDIICESVSEDEQSEESSAESQTEPTETPSWMLWVAAGAGVLALLIIIALFCGKKKKSYSEQ